MQSRKRIFRVSCIFSGVLHIFGLLVLFQSPLLCSFSTDRTQRSRPLGIIASKTCDDQLAPCTLTEERRSAKSPPIFFFLVFSFSRRLGRSISIESLRYFSLFFSQFGSRNVEFKISCTFSITKFKFRPEIFLC